VSKKQLYSQGDYSQWLQAVLGQAQPYLSNLLGDYFGATAPTMGGAFGGQQGNFAAQGVASQLPQFANIAGQLTQGQNQMVVNPGSQGLLGAALPAFAKGLGGSSGPLLGKLLGLGGGGGIAGQSGPASYGANMFRPDPNLSLITRT
jgi:hypothetical protein